MPYYFPIAGERRDEFMPFPWALVWSETLTALSRFWTWIVSSNFYDINHYAKCFSFPEEKMLSEIFNHSPMIKCTRQTTYSNTIITVLEVLWCNGYRRRKWTRWHEFKSWTRLIAFHIALIPLGKVWIQLFSLQLWVNSRADCALQPWWGN